MSCSAKDCESIAFCPNRFSACEMLDIQLALDWTCKTMLATRREFRPSDGLTLRDINNHIADMKNCKRKLTPCLSKLR